MKNKVDRWKRITKYIVERQSKLYNDNESFREQYRKR